jgi:hypothetical protein
MSYLKKLALSNNHSSTQQYFRYMVAVLVLNGIGLYQLNDIFTPYLHDCSKQKHEFSSAHAMCSIISVEILLSEKKGKLALSNTHSSTQQYFRYMVAVIIKFCNYIICRNSNDQ